MKWNSLEKFNEIMNEIKLNNEEGISVLSEDNENNDINDGGN